MSIKLQILCILVCFFLSFVFCRGFFYGIKRYRLNNSAYKKRKKDEALKEWLLYSRYKEEIPKVLLVLYYIQLLIHPFSLVVCILLYSINLPGDIGTIIVKVVYYFDVTWILTIALLFWSPGREYAYGRWMSQKRKKRKND